MRTRSTRRAIAPLLLTLLLAILSLSCSILGPTAQQISDQTAVAGMQASLSALSDMRTSTVAALSDQQTATQVASATHAAQAKRDSQATSTARTVMVTATAAQALGETNAPAGWKLAFYDSFEDNDNRWPVGKDDSSEFSHSDIKVEQNEYLWTAKARQGFVSWGDPRTGSASLTDFYVMVDGKLESGEESTAYGLVTRLSGQNFYVFEVNEQGGWAILVLKNNIWNSLRSGRSSQIIKGGNHLAVKGTGTDFVFYVNGVEIARVSDERLAKGGMGVIMDMNFRGAESTVSFDNFTLLTP